MNDTNDVKSQTPKEYARELLEDSLVNGLPNIVKTPSLARKAFKTIVLVMCLCGFLYQTSQFLAFVLTYPSVVDIEVFTPDQAITPAVTFCNNNGINRSKFCKKYPKYCETPQNKMTFCNDYPHYCHNLEDWDNFKVPKPEYYDFEKGITMEELNELGHDFQSLVKNIDIRTHFADDYSPSEYNPEPLIFLKMDKCPLVCYSIMSRANSHEEPVFNFRDKGLPSFVPSLEIILDFEEKETFVPGREPGGLVSLHSPFDFVNPHQNGYSLKPGEVYKIHYNLEEETLLPWPYRTDCTNYTLRWLEHGRQGPRSQMMCKETCAKDFYLIHFNCSPTDPMAYPFEGRKWCDENDLKMTESSVEEYFECVSECKDDCEKYKFIYDVQERLLERGSFFNTMNETKKKLTLLEFYTLDPEVVVLKYRPQYQSIEIFSYIGGYIGAWLGISLIAVMDFLESMGLLAIFTFRKRREKCDKEMMNSNYT